MTAGSITSDHNDMAFVFFITASIWTFLEFRVRNKPRWVIAVGIFAGIAILNKDAGDAQYPGTYFFSQEEKRIDCYVWL